MLTTLEKRMLLSLRDLVKEIHALTEGKTIHHPGPAIIRARTLMTIAEQKQINKGGGLCQD